MSDLKFTYLNPQNGTLVSKTPFNSTTRYTTPSICYSKNGTINYIPLITTTGYVDIDGYRYSYDSSDPIYNKTLHCIYNGVEYVVPNKSEQLIDIPAGTYTPSAFESLISTFIGRNTKRQVANDFSVTVGGGAGRGTVQCLAGSYIGYSNPTMSTYAANPHSVRFNYNGTAANLTRHPDWSSGLYFRNNGIYITYAVTGQSYNNYNFNGYANFNIEVTTGIKFM